jgi:hypothetical protein
MLSQGSFWKRASENSNNLILGFLVLLFSCSHFIGFSQATLPLSRSIWDAGAPTGWTDNGTSAYTTTFACTGSNSGQLNSTGDYYQIFFSSAPDQLTFTLKGASFSGGTFTVEESVDGVTWSTLSTFTSITSSCNKHTYSLACDTRYVRFFYSNKDLGNIAIDDVSITSGPGCTPCSGCSINNAGLTSVSCNNNSTNDITTDDRITFSLNPTGCDLSSTYTVSVSGGAATSISPTSASYGGPTNFTLNSGSAGGGNVTVTITDASGASCFMDIVVGDPGSCSGVMPSACAKIIQFQVDPETGNNGSDFNTGEFIQICNICTGDVDISCFVLCFTANNSGVRRGECIRIPDNTILAPGECYLMGGNGTTGSGADWTTAEATLDLNWHTCGCYIHTDPSSTPGEFVGVLNDGGEDITLFDASGNIHSAITYASGGGASYSQTVNIPSGSGCGAVDVTIPPTSTHTNIGSTPSGTSDDEGWYFDCTTQSWVFANHDTSDAHADLFPNMTYDCPLITLLSETTITLGSKINDNHNELFWYTLDETNVEFYVLEKSENGKDFSIVQNIASNNSGKYSYNDYFISSMQFYRVVVSYLDGSKQISKLEIITRDSKQSFGVSNIHPNPANTSFSFNFELLDRGTSVEFKMYNILGELILVQSLNSSQLVNLPSDDLESGIYYLVFSNGSEQQSHKLLIQH